MVTQHDSVYLSSTLMIGLGYRLLCVTMTFFTSPDDTSWVLSTSSDDMSWVLFISPLLFF